MNQWMYIYTFLAIRNTCKRAKIIIMKTVTFHLLSIRLVSQGDCCMAVSFLTCNDIIIKETNTNKIKWYILHDIIEYNFLFVRMIYAKTANRIHKTHIEREQKPTAFTVKCCLLWMEYTVTRYLTPQSNNTWPEEFK